MRVKLLLILIVTVAGLFFMNTEKFSATLSKLQKTKPDLKNPTSKHREITMESLSKKIRKEFNLNVQTIDDNNWYVINQETDLICLNLSFKNAGNAYEAIPGTLSILADMLKEGTKDLDSKAFKEFLLNNQIQLFSNFDIDNASITIRTTKEHFNDAIEALRMIFTGLRLDQKDLERIKRQNINELSQSKNDPSAILREKLPLFAYKKHPGFDSIDDEIDGVKKVTANDLREHMTNYFAKNNLQTVCVGNISKEAIINAINTVKSMLPDTRKETTVAPVEFDNQGKIGFSKMAVPQSVVGFVTPSLERTNEDFLALYVFNNVLGGTSFESRLWYSVREKSGLAYYVNTYLGNSQLLNNLKGITAVKTDKVREVINIIKNEMKELLEKGITQKDLDFQKMYLAGSFATDFDSTLDITQKLSAYQSFKLPPDYVNHRNKMVADLTVEKVNAVGKQYLNPETLTFFIVGDHD